MGCKITVEVPLFFAFFAFLLTDSVNINIMIYRTCYVILGFDKHNCSLLGNTNNNITKDLEKLVQPKADLVGMVKSSVDSISAALLCLFVGAWSDRFGRKPVIIANLIGYTLMLLVMVVFSAIDAASPWYMIACSIPVILTGGGASLLTVLLAYLTDITSEEHRGFRMGLFEGVMALAVLLGSSSSSYLLNSTSYIIVYLIAALSCFLGLLYTILFLPESLENPETENKFQGLFETQNISGMFETTFRKRPHYNRSIILLIIFALALYFVVIAGDGSVMFLFMRAKFQWTLKMYTWFNSAGNIMWISGTTLIVYIVHFKLKVKESILIFIGFISMMIGMILQGLAQVGWLIYVAAVVKIPSSSISPMTRSLISKSVNGDEVGKIFSVFTMMQNLLGMVGAPVYTFLYNATLNTNPGLFNFVTASGNAVNALCLLLVLILQNKPVRDGYSRVEGNNSETAENARVPLEDGTSDEEPLLVNC